MSFTRTGDFYLIVKGKHTAAKAQSPVTASLHKDTITQRRGGSPIGIAVRLLGVILDELGWKPGDYVEVHEGAGSSAGKLLLVATDVAHEGYRLSFASTSSKIRAGSHRRSDKTPAVALKVAPTLLKHHTVQRDAPTAAVACNHRIFNSELLVEMPHWFKPTAENIARVQRVIAHDISDDADEYTPEVKRPGKKGNRGAQA